MLFLLSCISHPCDTFHYCCDRHFGDSFLYIIYSSIIYLFCFVFSFTRLMSLPGDLSPTCMKIQTFVATFWIMWHVIVSAKRSKQLNRKHPKLIATRLSPFPPSRQYHCFMLLCHGQLWSIFRTHCFTVIHSQSQASWAKLWQYRTWTRKC